MLEERGAVPKSQAAQLQHLRHLADQPTEQARYAATLLNPRLGNELVISALQILTRRSHPAARPALLALYDHYAANNGKTRDPAANLRASVLRALRPLIEPADAELLVQAAETYVFPPPSFKEEGALLRSAALNALNEVEESLARYHAIRLLANEHTDPMSAEPALSAARLLATHGEWSVLYFYVSQDGARTLPEVLGECLRHLTRLPVALLPGLIARYAANPQAVVLVGLFDLLVFHQDGPQGLETLRTYLREGTDLDAYRYLVTILVSAGRPALLAELLAAARVERQPDKRLLLIDALTVLADNPTVAPVLAELQPSVWPKAANPL
jgi:hypothetical protein